MVNKNIPAMTRTQAATDIAEIFDVHLKTVHGWRKDGCPHGKRGRDYLYNDGEVQAWLTANNRNTKPGRPAPAKDTTAADDLGGDKDYWLARKYKNQCLQDEGRLVPAEEVAAAGAEAINAFQRRLAGGGAILAVQTEGRDTAERQEIIDKWHDDILADLAKGLRAMGERGRTAQEVHA